MAKAIRGVVVTGANKGIGLAIVERLLAEREDTHVFLGSRSVARGQEARAGLLARNPAWESRVAVLQLDVDDEASVQAATRDVAAQVGTLYGLVNNAGIVDGTPEKIIATNVVSVKRVSDAFMPLLQTPGGRIVNLSSGVAPNFVGPCSPERQRFFVNKTVSWAQIQAVTEEFLTAANSPGEALAAAGFPRADSGLLLSAYGFSKACLNSLTMFQAASRPDLIINACTPGFIATDLTREMVGRRGGTPEAAGALSVEKGTISTWRLLFGDLPAGMTGKYFGSDGLRSPMDKYRKPTDPEYTGE